MNNETFFANTFYHCTPQWQCDFTSFIQIWKKWKQFFVFFSYDFYFLFHISRQSSIRYYERKKTEHHCVSRGREKRDNRNLFIPTQSKINDERKSARRFDFALKMLLRKKWRGKRALMKREMKLKLIKPQKWQFNWLRERYARALCDTNQKKYFHSWFLIRVLFRATDCCFQRSFCGH